MEAKEYLRYIVHEIHTTIVATVDAETVWKPARREPWKEGKY